MPDAHRRAARGRDRHRQRVPADAQGHEGEPARDLRRRKPQQWRLSRGPLRDRCYGVSRPAFPETAMSASDNCIRILGEDDVRSLITSESALELARATLKDQAAGGSSLST